MPTKTTKPKKTKFADVKAKATAKAKAAYDKGTAAFGEAKTFTKGNVDAMVESGKILGTGLKAIGEGYVAEGKTAVATAQREPIPATVPTGP